jgi:hypothetical protein
MGPPEPDDTGTTTTESDQHLPAQPAITLATGPGRTCRATCEQLLLLLPQPTDRHPALDSSHVGPAASATPQPPRIHTGGRSAVDPVGARHSRTHDHPFPASPQFGAATTQSLADHRDISHPTRPDVGGPTAPTHARIQRCADSADAGATVTGGVSVRTPGSRRSRGHRTSARPSGQTSARRTADADRRPMACPASGYPRRPRPLAAGLAQPARVAGSAALGHP